MPIGDIPEETARVAKAAFRKPSAAMRLRDEFGVFYQDEDFAALFSVRGQPAFAPWRLALVTVLQYMENLTDRQAADAVPASPGTLRGRLDWKYALGFELEDPGFDASVLSEFRGRLSTVRAKAVLLDKMLVHFKSKGLVKERGKQRSDSTHVLGWMRTLNLLELVGETIPHAGYFEDGAQRSGRGGTRMAQGGCARGVVRALRATGRVLSLTQEPNRAC